MYFDREVEGDGDRYPGLCVTLLGGFNVYFIVVGRLIWMYICLMCFHDMGIWCILQSWKSSFTPEVLFLSPIS